MLKLIQDLSTNLKIGLVLAVIFAPVFQADIFIIKNKSLLNFFRLIPIIYDSSAFAADYRFVRAVTFVTTIFYLKSSK